MTKGQRKTYKMNNQIRKARLLALYYKVKPTSRGWIPLGNMIQNGRYTVPV